MCDTIDKDSTDEDITEKDTLVQADYAVDKYIADLQKNIIIK